MTDAMIEHRRKKLSLAYTIPTERRMRAQGYQVNGSSRRPNPVRRLVTKVQYQLLPHYWLRPPRWRVLTRALFGGRRTLPDFYVVGPIKSATSDLAVNLLLHPNVMLPLAKELWGRHPEQWRAFYPTEKQKRRYAEQYGLALSPYLGPVLDDMELPYNVSRVQPVAKVVLTLRNPAERVFSHWKWEFFLSGRKAAALPFLSSFPAFVDTSLEVFANGRMYTRCGSDALLTSIYWKSVKHWIDCFGADNVLVVDIANYFRNREPYLKQIYDFVGLPHVSAPPSTEKINESPIAFPPADDVTMSKLKRFFEPHNEKLWNVIGKRFDW